MDNLFEAAKQFVPNGSVREIRELGNGNINDTFLVSSDAPGQERFILQRVNTRVFLRPELIMHNMGIATSHIRRHLKDDPVVAGRRWEVPRVFCAKDGRDHWIDGEGAFWRAISFIEGARSFETIVDMNHAHQVGYAVGMFHALLSDLPAESLYDTLDGFHITPLYMRRFEKALAACTEAGPPEAKRCLRFVSERHACAGILEEAKASGRLCLRPIHGDPKVNNIMIDTGLQCAVSIVDLDTVKPGLIHYDIGDCLRSGCNRLGEETERWEEVHFDCGICREILRGYIREARKFLSGDDFDYIYDSIHLITFELGLRFLTDYLEGNIYFKISHPAQNLVRALVQFRLAESIELQQRTIQSIIKDFR